MKWIFGITLLLNKAKVTSKGKITRTTLILLGKDESEHLLNPADVKIRLMDELNNDIDYKILEFLLFLSVRKYLQKLEISNIDICRGTIFPTEVAK